MKLAVGILALTLVFFIIPVAASQAQFIAEDLGECAVGVFEGYAAHEWGHDLATLAMGDRPWNFLALWGDKWNESQPHFRTNALGGFIGQHTLAAFYAVMPDSYSRCVVHGDTLISLVYALRAAYFPNDAGDYDPFSLSRRREITAVNIGASFFFEALSLDTAAEETWLRFQRSIFGK